MVFPGVVGRADHGSGQSNDRGKTYQRAGRVDARVAGPDAVKPLRLAELPKAVFGHLRSG